MTPKTKVIFDIGQDQRDTFDWERLSQEGIHCTTPEEEATNDTFLLISTHSPNFEEYLKNPEAYHLPTRTFIFSPDSDEENILQTLQRSQSNHLIGNGPYATSEVITNIRKVYHGKTWGLEKNLKEDAQIKSINVNHSKDLDAEFEKLLSGLSFQNFFDTPLSYLRIVANELGTNAFYHSEEGEEVERTQSIFLSSDMAIEMKIGIDRERVALSIKDHIGELDRDKFLSSVGRGFREKTPSQRERGAGLGLYMVYNHSNQVIINTHRNQSTEVIAIIDANKRYLNYKKRVTSFHYFEEN